MSTFWRETAILQFSSPFGDLRTTGDVQLRLVGKLAVDFLFDIFPLGIMADVLEVNTHWKLAFSLQQGHVEGPPPTIMLKNKPTKFQQNLFMNSREWSESVDPSF